MKKYLSVIPLVVLLSFVVGCQQSIEEVAEEIKVDVGTDIDTIREWVNGNFDAADSGNLEGYLSYWTEDVIWMPPNAPIMQGKITIKEFVQPMLELYTIHRNFSIEEIKADGDFAFARTNSEETYSPKAGEGESIKSNGKTMFLLKRMPDGTWQGTHCIWNSNDPLPPSEENQ
jgi:uncharacterized protein (TIGR02246 family)